MELELKFDVAEPDARRLLERFASSQAVRRRTLVSVYFDTPDALLRRNGLVLRIRDDGERRVQAIKARGPSGAGFLRGEWEAPVDDFQPDFAAVADTPLAKICTHDIRETLKPVFKVDVERVGRLVETGAATVEMVFDLGEVRLNGTASAVCELEMELKSGPAEALFALAREISRDVVLDLSFTGKADRGYGLLQAASSTTLRLPAIDPKGCAADAFRVIAAAALAQMADSARSLRTNGDDAKTVHRLRVGARRLRSAITLFKPMLTDDGLAAVKAELKWLGGELNDARNLDVFIADVAAPLAAAPDGPPGLPALDDSLAAARDQAYRRVASAVGSARFRALMLETALWVEFGGWSMSDDPDRAKRRERSIRKTAADLLDRRYRKLVKAGRALEALSPEERHHLRISAKTLRYAAEFFAGLYRGESAHAHAGFVRTISDLQDALGGLNDIATARGLVTDVVLAEHDDAGDPWRAYAVGLAVGARQAQAPKALKAAVKAYREMAKAPPFW